MTHPLTYPELVRLFGRIGCLSFGGPAAQIALMQRELVDEQCLLTRDGFLKALSFCMLLPGPEAMQLATYAGWKLRGVPGGLIAGSLFVLPGALVIAVLALLYSQYGASSVVQATFLGLKAAVIVIVVQAIVRLVHRALNGWENWVLAALAFVALFVFNLPFPLVIFLAGLYGYERCRASGPVGPHPPWRAGLRSLALGSALWILPLVIAWITGATFLLVLGMFFSILAVVTFGGAYAVLAYMTQAVVTDFGWITTGQMMDGLGLAETTPGPLILVTQFVAMLAGAGQGGTGLALLAGAMALWVTFVPCFIWIFAGAPLIDWLDTAPRLRAALAAITAAVVGVIANLSLWFTIHVLFDTVRSAPDPWSFPWPEWSSLNITACGLAALAAAMILWRKWSLLVVLPIMAGAGALASGIMTG